MYDTKICMQQSKRQFAHRFQAVWRNITSIYGVYISHRLLFPNVMRIRLFRFPVEIPNLVSGHIVHNVMYVCIDVIRNRSIFLEVITA